MCFECYVKRGNQLSIAEAKIEGLEAEISQLRQIVGMRRDPKCNCNCHNQPSSMDAMGLAEHETCYECATGLFEESEQMREDECNLLGIEIELIKNQITQRDSRHNTLLRKCIDFEAENKRLDKENDELGFLGVSYAGDEDFTISQLRRWQLIEQAAKMLLEDIEQNIIDKVGNTLQTTTLLKILRDTLKDNKE